MKSIVWFGFVLGAVSVAGKVFYAKPGGTVVLECGTSIIPSTLIWHHRGQQIISVDGKSGFTRKEKSYVSRIKIKQATDLELSGVREEEAGSFLCDAAGTKHEHTLVVVSVSVSPSNDLEPGSKATLQCHVKGLTEGYTVQWRRPNKTTSTRTEKVELESVASSDAGPWMCVISHKGKEEHSENLKLEVKASPTTSPSQIQRTKDSHSPTCPHCAKHAIDKLHWWVWVAIGVGCLVVILLVVFVIFMCKRIRRKKRKFQYIKNGRQPKQYCQCNRPTAAARPQQGHRKEKPLTLHVQPLLIE